MDSPRAALPLLPLLLWETPPGLEMALDQEGVPWRRVGGRDLAQGRHGRFVVYDGRRLAPARVVSALAPDHIALDVRRLLAGAPSDPLDAMVDTTACRMSWTIAGRRLHEQAARVDRGQVRAEIVARLRAAVVGAGGVWVRMAPLPHPYRSAFNLRVDLDEPLPDDYDAFARARRPLEDCTTHFVSTRAYGRDVRVLHDLRGRDAQSHGHVHHVYRDEATNRRNLARAHEWLECGGIRPVGFAAPGGRWNRGLDRSLEALGYRYSSDFHLGRDDWPFFPWLGDRFSPVLQVPIHPVCEGLFFEAGIRDEPTIAAYYERVVRALIAGGLPAFVYGHPERRLARLPGVLDRLAGTIRDQELLWRVTLTRFADWWRWRLARQWTVTKGPGPRLDVRFADRDTTYTPALEIVRETHTATIPATTEHFVVDLDSLAFERRRLRADLPRATAAPAPWSLRNAARRALDWETETPVAELPTRTARQRLKKRLRQWGGDGGRP
jgi:hypothetical protein